MASYSDFPLKLAELPDIILDKLASVYSVEVVRRGRRVTLRVWFDKHCEVDEHEEIE